MAHSEQTEQDRGRLLRSTELLWILQALMTLALLIFAFVVHGSDRTIATVVTSAAVFHWLREAPVMGRQAADRTVMAERERKNGDG